MVTTHIHFVQVDGCEGPSVQYGRVNRNLVLHISEVQECVNDVATLKKKLKSNFTG